MNSFEELKKHISKYGPLIPAVFTDEEAFNKEYEIKHEIDWTCKNNLYKELFDNEDKLKCKPEHFVKTYYNLVFGTTDVSEVSSSTDIDNEIHSILKIKDLYINVDYYYSSYDNCIPNFHVNSIYEVKPKRVTITKYEKV